MLSVSKPVQQHNNDSCSCEFTKLWQFLKTKYPQFEHGVFQEIARFVHSPPENHASYAIAELQIQQQHCVCNQCLEVVYNESKDHVILSCKCSSDVKQQNNNNIINASIPKMNRVACCLECLAVRMQQQSTPSTMKEARTALNSDVPSRVWCPGCRTHFCPVCASLELAVSADLQTKSTWEYCPICATQIGSIVGVLFRFAHAILPQAIE